MHSQNGVESIVRVAMMQPAFLPWQGFFELIYQSDHFIFLDDFQFSIQSYHQRNRLFVNPGQVDWYTVPVEKTVSFLAPLNQTQMRESAPWRKKLWKRIQANYSKTPYYKQLATFTEKWLSTQYPSLADQNIAFILYVCELLELQPVFDYSSRYPSQKQRSARVLELLQLAGTSRYYSAQGSFRYMLEDGVFPTTGIEILFQDFRPAAYVQYGSPDNFTPYLSILDALFNIGPSEAGRLVKNGTAKWLTWDEMVTLQQAQEHG